MTSSWKIVQSRADVSHTRFALFLGDARKLLLDLPAESVNTCLTSPPYWSARDDEHASQIGQEAEVEEYVQSLVEVFSVVRDALREDGSVWLNLGDAYLDGVSTVNGKPPEKCGGTGRTRD